MHVRRILFRVAKELEDVRRFQLHRGREAVVALPDRDHDEGEQHGVERPDHLELRARDVVVQREGVEREQAPGDEQPEDRQRDAERDDPGADDGEREVRDRGRHAPRP